MKLSEIKMALQAVLLQFKKWDAEGGFSIETTEEELAEGLDVIVYGPDGAKLENPDGEYLVDGNRITIVESKVKAVEPVEKVVEEEVEVEAACGDKKEIKAEAEEEVAAEPEMDEKDAKIAELEAEIIEKAAEIEKEKAEIEALKARIAELEAKPAAEPLEEEFAKANEPVKTGNKKMDRLCQILNAK